MNANSGKTKLRDELGRSIRMLKRLRRFDKRFRYKHDDGNKPIDHHCHLTRLINQLQAIHLKKVQVTCKGKIVKKPWVEIQWLKTLNKNQPKRATT